MLMYQVESNIEYAQVLVNIKHYGDYQTHDEY